MGLLQSIHYYTVGSKSMMVHTGLMSLLIAFIFMLVISFWNSGDMFWMYGILCLFLYIFLCAINSPCIVIIK